jgi:drug/metabolite transporter (DMT)-like permease
MENNILRYIAIGYVGVVVAALAQVMLKKGVKAYGDYNYIRLFVNGYTLTGYFMMFCVTLLSLYIFRYLDLKYALILLPSTYILVLLFSGILLQENITKREIIQYAFILLGIIIFNL